MGLQLVDYVGCAPEVCNFVFEEASRKWKDAVDKLCELLEKREVPPVVVDLCPESSKERKLWRFAIEFWNSVDSAAAVVKCAEKKGQEEEREGGECDYCNFKKPSEVEFGEDADAEKVGKKRWSVVECHLLESECCDEEDAAPHKASCHDARHAGNNEAEHDCVVLKVHMVNEDNAGLHEDSSKSNSCIPRLNALEACEASDEDYCRWDVDEVF